jgi:hypothetical protein
VSATGFRPGEYRATSTPANVDENLRTCAGDSCNKQAATFSYNDNKPYCCDCLHTMVQQLADRRTPASRSTTNTSNATIQVKKFIPSSKSDSVSEFRNRVEEEMLSQGIGRDVHMVNRHILFNIAEGHREQFNLGSSNFLQLDWTLAWDTLRREFQAAQTSYVEAMARLQQTKASRTDPSLAASLNKYERQFLLVEATHLDQLGYAANFDELQVLIMKAQTGLQAQQTKCSELWETLRTCIAAFMPRAILAALGHGWSRRQCTNVADYLEFRHDAIEQWRRILDNEKPGVFAIHTKQSTRQPTTEQLASKPSACGFRICRCGLDHFRTHCKYNAAVAAGKFRRELTPEARASLRKELDRE